MAIPFIRTAFALGEIAPNLFGRVDLARFQVAASTMRNLFVRYTGGAVSRAGTAFVGYSKQTGRHYPPRFIPFQFNIAQGLVLEFGEQYMRLIQDGRFVTEEPVTITNITNSPVAEIFHSPTSGGQSAVADNGAVLSSYNRGDQVTLAGGVFTVPGVIEVDTSILIGAQPDNSGVSGVYAPGDTIFLTGGVAPSPPLLTVTSTQVVGATVAAGGASGANGAAVVIGTTGTGTPFQANVTIAAGAITSVNSIAYGGDYSVNPATPTTEPVTGAGLVGAQLNLTIGIRTAAITNGGEFTANPAASTMTQGSTTGAGLGIQFISCLFGVNDCHFSTAGAYTTFPPNPVEQASTTGTGIGITFIVTAGPGVPFNDGDWVYVSGVNGMTEVNGGIFVIHAVNPTFFDIYDVFGNPINSTAFETYTGGGLVARIYTVPTPYREQDIRYLKFDQSADVVTLCCLNQETLVEYQPQELARNGVTNWTLNPLPLGATVQPPTGITLSATSAGDAFYSYRVTGLSVDDGSESIGSPRVDLGPVVNIATTAGSITLTWTASAGVQSYNVYKATPGYQTGVPGGVSYGFIGSSAGTQFLDSNNVPDFAQVPPLHRNPFARGAIVNATPVSGGTGYTTANVTINTTTGSGAVVIPLIKADTSVSGYIVENGGEGYAASDTITVGGDGSGATASLTVGPQTGTYPSVCNYFQQRHFFANSINFPITFWASQTGAFLNFDARVPPLDSDAITGSPISVQVNGIQFMVNMPGGLVLFTGLGAYQLTGAGGSSLTPLPITPTTAQAQPQGVNGCHSHVAPITIGGDIIYLQQLGSIFRNLSYNIAGNIYTGIDLTLNSSHLFTGYSFNASCWCEEPFKIIWAVREDGLLLSLTIEKAQEIAGWARHDTQGLYRTVCSVVEPPFNALYLCSERFVNGQRSYMVERMNERQWETPEDQWCVDVAVSIEQPTPNAILQVSSAVGLGAISGFTDLVGGSGYSAGAYAEVVDDNGLGPGTGAHVTLVIVGGAIVNVVINAPGQGYTYPALRIFDPAGSDGGTGASAVLRLDNRVQLVADAPVFAVTSIGSVVRTGGGVMTVTQYISNTVVNANMDWPIAAVIPNTAIPAPAQPGDWTMTAPVTTIGGLRHLIGATVTGLYDGKVLPPVVVPPSAQITLPEPATSGVVGLGFQAQLQSPYLETAGVTVQGQRKVIPDVVIRIQSSRGIKVGTNQTDGSTLTPMEIAPAWTSMKELPNPARAPYGSTIPALWTGDVPMPVMGAYARPGQVAMQQDYPLAMNILAVVSDALPGDLPEAQAGRRRRGRDTVAEE